MTHRLITALIAAASVSLVLTQSVCAEEITFETLPNGTPLSGGIAISNQFAVAPYGVSFRFEDGSFPVIRKVGGTINGKATAFWGYPNGTGANMPAPGQNVGTNFLSDDGQVDAPPAPFVITYGTPVAEASAFILDIDHYEAWDIYARDAQAQVLGQVHLEHDMPGTGDGVATPFSFSFPSNAIKSLRIVFTGNTNEQPKVGLAFDSFSPATRAVVPGPATLSIRVLTNAPAMSNYANISISGTPQAVYELQSIGKLQSTNAAWVNEASFIMPQVPYVFSVPMDMTNRFYRALGVQ